MSDTTPPDEPPKNMKKGKGSSFVGIVKDGANRMLGRPTQSSGVDEVVAKWSSEGGHKLITLEALKPEERTFVEDCFKTEMGHFIRAVLQPFKIDDAYFSGSAVMKGSDLAVFDHAAQLEDILLKYYLEERFYLCRIDAGGGVNFVVHGEPKKDPVSGRVTVAVGTGNGKAYYPVIQWVRIKGIATKGQSRLLFTLFRLLMGTYKGIENALRFSNKVIVSIEGLTALHQQMATNNQASAHLGDMLDEQIISIIKKNVAILDSKTVIQCFAVDISSARIFLDFMYDELARLTKIPKTHLLGDSPSGMNATGEFDAKSYEDLIMGVRTSIVEPILDGLGYGDKYTVSAKADLVRFKEALITAKMVSEDLTIKKEGKEEAIQGVLAEWVEADQITVGDVMAGLSDDDLKSLVQLVKNEMSPDEAIS